MQQVLDNLKDLPPGTDAKDIDLIFLKGIMESPIVRSLAKVRVISDQIRRCNYHHRFLQQRGSVSLIAIQIKSLCSLVAGLLLLLLLLLCLL